MQTLREAVEQLIQAIERVQDAWEDNDVLIFPQLADAIVHAGCTAEAALDLLQRDLVESRSVSKYVKAAANAVTEALKALRFKRVRRVEPREYGTAAEAIHEAQVRADREGRTAFVWYRYCPRWAVRDTEPTEADYAEGWMLAARAPSRRSRR